TGNPLVTALGASGVSLSLAGRLEQGWDHAAQALARAEESNQLGLFTFTLLYAEIVKHLRGEYDEVGQLAQQMEMLAREHEFPLAVTLGTLLHGGMVVRRGVPEQGMELLTTGLAQYRATGAQLLVPYFLSFLAEGYTRKGQIAEALQVVNDALNLTATNLDVFWEAELYRLKGELSLQSGQVADKSKTSHNQSRHVRSPRPAVPHTQPPAPDPQAEACFLKAIEIARQQEAKLLELRATMSLAHLWQQQRKKKEARQRLSEIYNWFTEGLDAKDLQAAKSLLAELA